DDVLGHTSGVAALLIGDVKQAIYRWRGGDWDILAKGASLHFQGRSGDGEHLTTNWRSEPMVVEFNNHLIGSVVHECSLKIESFLESSPALVQELGGAIGLAFDNFEQQSAPIFEQGSGYVELCRTDEPLERILQTVADILSRGYTQRDIAILVRTKVQGAQVAQQLVNGGYNVISEQALEIGSCSTISLIVAFISVAMNREDMILGELLELRLGGHLTAEQLNVVDMIPLMSPLDAAVATVECLGLGHEDVSYIQGFYQAILDFCGRCVADTTLFLEWWHQSGQHTALELPSAQDAIKVDTIHRSKGLEYPCVVIPFADWSLLPATGSVLWSESMVSPFLVFNPIPLSFKKDIATSVYAESYLREVVYSHIDNVNMLYVALTRARGELYLNIPTEPRVNTIAELIDQALDEGNFEESVFTFGSKKIVHGAAATTPQEGLIFDSFEQHEFGPRVSVSWRYDLEGLSHELSPREKGVLQHGFFAQIALATDVRPLLDRMLLSGDIDDAQGDMLADSFNSLLGNPLATEWFNGTWELFSERSIITSDNQTYRPDRVMIHGHSAIVVDYKFGLVRTKSHLDQVQQYMQLLSAMGYVDVRGYLWYAAWQDVVSC
ncbi:MAG: 3'-5' exonuclease, partial [Mucinivorans sp.]